MNIREEERLKEVLQGALPKVEAAQPSRDLWPAVLRRIDEKPSAPPWFDWALAGGLAAGAIFFPTAIPVLLYYL
jgi:hypothetical protein